MKNTLHFIAFVFAMAIFSSCSGDGNKVSEVKLIPVKSGKDFQYIDQEGKIVINPQFSEATIFRNGMALVKSSGNEPKWGFILENGKFAITPSYKAATYFSNDLAWVISENAAPKAINSKGEIKITLQDAESVRIFKEGLAAYSIADSIGVKWGFVDKEGKVKINPQFSYTDDFSNGKCAVKNSDGKWGYIDKEGKIIINHQFDRANQFINNKAIVVLGEKSGTIDEDGKYIINPQFSNMINDGNNYLIEQDGKWGWCNKEGQITINPQFEEAYPFKGNDLAAVKSGESYGYIDEDGKIIINPQFDHALPFNGKLALVQSSGKIGFIDNKGKYIINPQFEDVSYDLVTYLINGNSNYQSVKTDFFNIGAIVSRMNFNKPEGLSLASKFSDITDKFKKSGTDFSKYSNEHIVIKNEKITNEASLKLYVLGDPFKEVQDGWYTEKIFNPEKIVQGYAYIIELSGKGYGKQKDVKDAIEKSFIGYVKDEVESSGDTNIYKNDIQTIKSFLNRSNVVVVIEKTKSTDDVEEVEEVTVE